VCTTFNLMKENLSIGLADLAAAVRPTSMACGDAVRLKDRLAGLFAAVRPTNAGQGHSGALAESLRVLPDIEVVAASSVPRWLMNARH